VTETDRPWQAWRVNARREARKVTVGFGGPRVIVLDENPPPPIPQAPAPVQRRHAPQAAIEKAIRQCLETSPHLGADKIRAKITPEMNGLEITRARFCEVLNRLRQPVTGRPRRNK
jgi:hypothetical protein